MTPFELRQKARLGEFTLPTSGHCPGYTQVNIIMPAKYADDFKLFCQLNDKACPLLDVTASGDPIFRSLGKDVDVRTDVPSYNVYHNGVLNRHAADISDVWQDDYVAFALGCSHSFEDLLTAQGMSLRYIERGHVVPAYVTNVKIHRSARLAATWWFPCEHLRPARQSSPSRLPKHFRKSTVLLFTWEMPPTWAS